MLSESLGLASKHSTPLLRSGGDWKCQLPEGSDQTKITEALGRLRIPEEELKKVLHNRLPGKIESVFEDGMWWPSFTRDCGAM